MIRASAAIAGCVALLSVPDVARAVTCQVYGYTDIQSWDAYYCDESVTGNDCSGWLEKNLDSTTQPMQYMYVHVEQSPTWNVLGALWTDSTGYYSIAWEAPSCSGTTFRVRHRFKRYKPGVTNAARFRITTSDETTTRSTLTSTYTFGVSPCATNTCRVDRHFTRTTSNADRVANVYYTANSAITQAASWSTNLDAQLWSTSEATDGTGMLRIVYDDTTPEYNNFIRSGWLVHLGWSQFRAGGNTRHEIGHAIQSGIHWRNQAFFQDTDTCYSMNLNGVGGHMLDGCEYGYTATTEGLASFFAVRSVTSGASVGNKNAWHCWCSSSSNQDICSETAKGTWTFSDADRVGFCDAGLSQWGFVGVGDDYAESVSRCTRLGAPYGCNCTDANGDGVCDGTWYQSNGHRNEVDVTRFFWDVLDNNNEGGTWPDTTDLDVYSLVSGMEGMGCVAGSGYGQDDAPNWPNGNCNEPNRANPSTCNPPDGQEPASFQTGNRDSYNPADLSNDAIIPGSQSDERTLNCVQNAGD